MVGGVSYYAEGYRQHPQLGEQMSDGHHGKKTRAPSATEKRFQALPVWW